MAGLRLLARPENSDLVLAWRPREREELHVEIVDSAGDVLRSWSGPLPPNPHDGESSWVDAHLVVADGYVYALWRGNPSNGLPNPLYFRKFGCLPPPLPPSASD